MTTEESAPPTPDSSSSGGSAAAVDYHRTKCRAFWPDADEYADAKQALGERGRYVSDYLRAALRWLNDAPADALQTLDVHWPPPRRPGRPRARDETRSDRTRTDQGPDRGQGRR